MITSKDIIRANNIYCKAQKLTGSRDKLRENGNSIVIALVLDRVQRLEKMIRTLERKQNEK